VARQNDDAHPIFRQDTLNAKNLEFVQLTVNSIAQMAALPRLGAKGNHGLREKRQVYRGP
jgi:hypothetical protein